MADIRAPLGLIALGLILWLAVNVTLAGVSIQVVGIILFASGVAWLILEVVQSRSLTSRRRTTAVQEQPIIREREIL